jgi:hypothetical protein
MVLDAEKPILDLDIQLPQVLGPETFEMEFYKHRRDPLITTSTNEASVNWPGVLPVNMKTRPCKMPHDIAPPHACWFREPYDLDFIEHLLDLYFCWIHPSYQIFPRDNFLHDFWNGIEKHCSRILVNAIASFACRYSNYTAAFAQPENPNTAGDQFFAEAVRLLQCSKVPGPMEAKSLILMSSRELCYGRALINYSHVRMYQDPESLEIP